MPWVREQSHCLHLPQPAAPRLPPPSPSPTSASYPHLSTPITYLLPPICCCLSLGLPCSGLWLVQDRTEAAVTGPREYWLGQLDRSLSPGSASFRSRGCEIELSLGFQIPKNRANTPRPCRAAVDGCTCLSACCEYLLNAC